MNEVRKRWAAAMVVMLRDGITPGRMQGVVNLLDPRWRARGGARG